MTTDDEKRELQENKAVAGCISSDPHGFETISTIAHHEAAHAVIAYYYGFKIARFRTTLLSNGIMTGAVRCQPNISLADQDLETAHITKVRELLAGELAARITLNIRTDQIVLQINQAETVYEDTSFGSVLSNIPPEDYDAIQVIKTLLSG